MSGQTPVRFLCAGIGGYAWTIAQQMRQAPDMKLVAMCDPALEQFPDRLATLREWDVNAYPDYGQMIASEKANAVWLPLPIHLHKPFALQALSAGLHVVTEKPAAGTLQDVDAMVRARDAAHRELLVGFQDIYSTNAATVKDAILKGALGKIESVSVMAAWPRDYKYFARNKWAGKLKMGDEWVLDSPLQNAISHHINLALFLIGEEPHKSATPLHVEAELYRANDIENFDTCALRVGFARNVSLMLFFTHAEKNMHEARIQIDGTAGQLTVDSNGYHMTGSSNHEWKNDDSKHLMMFRSISEKLRGQQPSTAVATLEMARNHTLLVNAVSQAAPITTIRSADITEVINTSNQPMKAVTGLAEIMQRCISEKRLPSELGDIAWAAPGGSLELKNYSQFGGPKSV